MESVRVGKLDGVRNTANTPLVCNLLTEKPYGIHMSGGVTLQSAKHHAAPPVYPCLPKKPIGIIRVGKHKRAPNTADARLVCTSFVDKPCGIRTSGVTK